MKSIEQIQAEIQQMGEQARAQSSEWFANRKRNFAIDDGQRHVDELNKMSRDANASMEKESIASKQRIEDYRLAGEQIISTARESTEFNEPYFEPDSDEGLADELLNRMNEQ